MAYSLREQKVYDLDIFCCDTKKIIHLASGGGNLPTILVNNDAGNKKFNLKKSSFSELFEIAVNPNLNSILGLNEIELEFYLRDFRKMAQRGFYSYDKTYIDEFENRFFHLVAYPKISKSASNEKKIYDKFIQDLFKSKELLRVRKLPINFEPFDL